MDLGSSRLTSPLKAPCPPKTRADLDYDRILLAVALRCAGPMGRDTARALDFAPTGEEAGARLEEAREAATLLEQGEPLAVGDVPDTREAIGRLRVGGALGAPELRGLADAFAAARTLRRFVASHRDTCPALYAACATDPTLDAIQEELASSFEADGTLADRASPRLRELRSEYHASRARMLSRLDDLMNRYEGILQDRFVTEREGRYVIPVRSDAHERFPGIVHATSASGATLFVEPRAVVPMGNRLKMLEAEVAREETAIYARLSGLVADVLPSVEAAMAAIGRGDVRAATALLARDLALSFVPLEDEPMMDLKSARHPLLALDALPDPDEPAKKGTPKAVVVPSDLGIQSGRGMIVSGPNAGGKTVALKTMGLAALMARAGLPIACGQGSRIGLFDIVLTDMGDDQSLTKNLSTFSAHVRNLASILDETDKGALVLLDELAGGTDPREGEALAAGVLDSLCSRGGAVVATTHYEGLKALALGDDRFQNASVGFDLSAMRPTFRLVIGVPGSSSALAVAARYGMPPSVIERAQRFLSHEDQSFESLVKKLNAERGALELARRAAEEREEQAARTQARLEAELTHARDRDQREMAREAEALLAALKRAREDLRAAQAKLRKKPDEGALREAGRTIDRVAASASLGGELEALTMRSDDTARPFVRACDLHRGTHVYVPKLRAEAEVLDVSPSGVRVAVGPMKLVVAREELRTAPSAKERPPAPERRPKTRSTGAIPEVPVQSRDNTCDLRGLRADDAVAMATTFLDRSLHEGRKVAFLIHGHGTGALREVIRRELRGSPYVQQFRAGETSEGGEGVTVVWLA